jgi:hypothetical protein
MKKHMNIPPDHEFVIRKRESSSDYEPTPGENLFETVFAIAVILTIVCPEGMDKVFAYLVLGGIVVFAIWLICKIRSWFVNQDQDK